MPDEIRPNAVRNVSVHTHNSSLKLSLFRVQSSAQFTHFILGPALCPSYSSLIPKPPQSHAQTTPVSFPNHPVSCPNHSSLRPKPLQSHAQTTPVSHPNHSSLTPKPLQSQSQITPLMPVSIDVMIFWYLCEAMNIITSLAGSPAL